MSETTGSRRSAVGVTGRFNRGPGALAGPPHYGSSAESVGEFRLGDVLGEFGDEVQGVEDLEVAGHPLD